MQAFEFHTIAQNGFIKIPDEYAEKIGAEIRVILLSDTRSKSDKAPVRKPLLELAGVFKNCGDIDLQEARTERLKKYEDIN